MKRIFLSLFTVFFLFLPASALAQTTSSGYLIESFDTNILVREDTSLFITETVNADFRREKHGIFRTIPTTYTADGRTIKTRLNILSVTDEEGDKHKYEISRLSGGTRLKIGDPNITITGPVTYVIKYTISEVLQRFDDHDELYWNVTGSQWDTDILEASAQVGSEYAEIIDVECFAGRVGSDSKSCTKYFDADSASFFSTTQLGSRRDMSIVVALNKDNELLFPGPIKRIANFIADNWGYAIALLPTTIIFIIWFKRGRDKRYLTENVYYKPEDVSTKTVSLFARPHLPMVYHPIDGLSPAEVGTIIDERIHISDIIAEFVELARLGFLKIQRIENKRLLAKADEYAFIKTKKTDDKTEVDKLKDYQKYILKEVFRSSVVHKSVKKAEKLFEKKKDKLADIRKKLAKKEYVLLSALSNHFYEGLPVIKDKLYKSLDKEKVFAEDPEKARKKWIGIFFLIEAAAAVIIVFFTVSTFNFGPIFAGTFLLIPGIIFAFSMPRRTANGYSLYRQIKGLKYYLEKGKWRHEITEKHLFLEEILPLAIALGVVNKLTKDMAKLGISPPSYFAGSSIAGFSGDFSLFAASSTGTFMSTSSGAWAGSTSWSGGSGFSGGGFSGGGFGGGGGGSW